MFLRPDKLAMQVFEYVLARGLKMYGIELHAFVVMSNHFHLVVSDVRGELPDFAKYLDGLTARALNCLRGRWDAFWENDSYNAVELLGDQDVVDKIVYTLLNPVKAGLVGKAKEWGGATSAGMGFGHCVVVERPAVFFSDDMPKQVTLRLVAPSFARGPGASAELRAKISEAVRDAETTSRERMMARGAKPVGMRAVLARDWRSWPNSPGPRRGLRPKFAGKCAETRRAALLAYKRWQAQYARVLKRFRAGERGVEFPAGTWRMAHRLGCVVALC